ncbi:MULTISPECIES: LacI family DNA-binding transcriptional regulator [unclassified Sinorhizobium]|uniref:LacI family DNA-binding transcriptional regulator n=1 Tax=unclassified Sinorhizobium TaxID=2613772 RepID=UPI0024C3269D|nr:MULTISPECIES: LacI family DNA-binding transcriptional regulator [unclassified Sinorhizobium]MDK1373694.1 LacI family DNA-binding transcriptional regulator [Sinorhizobium sp. 6-70]MDK1477744.1 LacI family DNA-binding transcriptional regulator [Sinorhizobium sp. 6-117]
MAKDNGRNVTRKETSGGRPTMTDVARIAGVSQSSVSLVLNDMSGARISAETRERVREAAQKIGYRLPSTRQDPAQAPAIEKDTIAFIVDEISTSPHPVVSLDGIRDYAFEQGLLVSAHATRSNPDLESAVLRAVLRDPAIAGVIYATIFTRKVSVPPELEGIPTVLLNCYAEPRQHMAIVPGEVAGGFAATAHLTSLGHRRIGFINGEPWMDAAVDRLKGYKQALATADIAFDEALVRDGDWLPLRGYQAGLDLLAMENPPTAILCGNDLMAIGVLEAASERGLRVPEDLSVMGYDDQELARYTHPPLSTLVLPNYEMGQRAAEILIDMAIHGKRPRPMTIKIDGPLVQRGTTAMISHVAARGR